MALPVLPPLPDLPVRAVLGAVTDALAAHGGAVLGAPPGTGETTLVPLALAAGRGRGVGAEPRRVAARAGGGRVAAGLGGTGGGACWSPTPAGWRPGGGRPGGRRCPATRWGSPSAPRCAATPAARTEPASRW